MNRCCLTVAVTILVIQFTISTQILHAGTNTVFDFLRNDVGARAGAMAGSFVSVTNDPHTLFYNPAGLSTLESPMGSIGFFKHLLDINSGYVSYSSQIDDLGYFGAGVVYFNYGSFDETDDIGNILGSFSANDLAVTLGYSNTFEENVHYGANVKFIYSSIAGFTSMGLAADAGFLINIPESRVTVGASLRNIGAQLTSFGSTREDLPLDLVVGASVVPRGLPLLLNVSFHKLNQDAGTFAERFKSFSIGGEFTLSEVLLARFGYDNEQRQELKIGTSAGLAGFSGGIGVRVKDYRVDYSLSSLGSIGNMHRVTVGTSF